jgi:hypothetical protein
MTDTAWNSYVATDAKISACYKAKCDRAVTRLMSETSDIPFSPERRTSNQAERYRIAQAQYGLAIREAGDQARRQQNQAEHAYNRARAT